MSTEKSVPGLVTPEENLITQLAGYIHGGRSIQMTTLVGVLQLLEQWSTEITSLNQQLSAKTFSEQNIINAFGISGEGAHSKLVIEYVHGLVAENARMREAIEFATAPDMWQEQHDGMLDYRYVDWYVDVLNAALEPKSTDAAIAELRAQGVDALALHMEFNGYSNEASGAREYAANLRAGRK